MMTAGALHGLRQQGQSRLQSLHSLPCSRLLQRSPSRLLGETGWTTMMTAGALHGLHRQQSQVRLQSLHSLPRSRLLQRSPGWLLGEKGWLRLRRRGHLLRVCAIFLSLYQEMYSCL